MGTTVDVVVTVTVMTRSTPTVRTAASVTTARSEFVMVVVCTVTLATTNRRSSRGSCGRGRYYGWRLVVVVTTGTTTIWMVIVVQ